MSFLTSGRVIHILSLFLILLLASVFRFWRLDSVPPGLYHDEAYNGLDALSLVQGKTFPQFYEGWELYAQDAHAERPPNETRWPVFFEGNFGREPLHIYLMALAIKLLGPTPSAIRIVPGIAGVLSVLTTDDGYNFPSRALQSVWSSSHVIGAN
jgi:4-amino-4-deoxy-L-arabinose transferase-like glycosyltransferase